MPTRPDSPDPTGATADAANPFATLGSGLGKGLDFFQDWMKAAGSALPHLSAATQGAPGAVPGWTVPTLDPAELDKRIQELKTVQFWLEQNARMIAMTIQGLEVQRMTLSTLQGMNVSMEQLKDALKVKPEAVAQFFKAGTATSEASASEAPDARPAAEAPPAEPPPDRAAEAPRSPWFQGVPDEPEPNGDGGSDDAPLGDTRQADSPEGAELINPMRWWDTLTQQFSHLAQQATAFSPPTAEGSPEHPQAPAPGPMVRAATATPPSGRRTPARKSAARSPAPPKAAAAEPATPTKSRTAGRPRQAAAAAGATPPKGRR